MVESTPGGAQGAALAAAALSTARPPAGAWQANELLY